MHHIVRLYGSAYPGIVAYTAREGIPALEAGMPEVNMIYCPGGGGNTHGLKAQKCTGLALTTFPGHGGYLVINDGEPKRGARALVRPAPTPPSHCTRHSCRRLYFAVEYACI